MHHHGDAVLGFLAWLLMMKVMFFRRPRRRRRLGPPNVGTGPQIGEGRRIFRALRRVSRWF